MKSQAARFLLLVVVFSGIGMLFYVTDYRLVRVPQRFIPATSNIGGFHTMTQNSRRYDANNRTFHVDSYNFINETLELKGFYLDDDVHGDNTNQIAMNTSRVGLHRNGADNSILKIEGLTDISGLNVGQSEISGETYFSERRRVTACDCSEMFKNSQTEILRAKTITRPKEYTYTPSEYVQKTKDCPKFIQERGYITDPLTQDEKEFPIAFSILLYKAVDQSERLLRAIYRPQNIYCLHVDKKSDQKIYDAMVAIARCFDNVFVTRTRFNVVWGTMTVLEPELQCMSELYNRSQSWKYFINLTGQEFPLRTNYELVQILRAYNGANDIDGTRKRANVNRWQKAGPPPHNIIPSKGSLHITASRGYVDFVLNDQRAKDFLEWCRNVTFPDEVFFTSLQHNPHLGVPGSYKGIPETFSSDDSNEKPFVTRFKNWGDSTYNWPCSGRRVRLICVFGVGDLPLLATRKELFANKFMSDFEPMTQDCLEELHFNRTRDIYLGKLKFDSTWYENLGFVKNKVK